MLLLPLLFTQGCIMPQINTKSDKKSAAFRQMNFQELINRYMQKETNNSIEGVYTVSGIVMKKKNNLLGEPKEKTTDRKENYATVAILREQGGAGYIELSLNKQDQTSYSIIGEFQETKTGSILVYKHFVPKGKDTSFTFTWDEKGELLEGIRVDNEGGTQVTYKLTYVKLKPD